ncbi:MAG: cation transporter [Acidobacteria bacterium]|nr:cation transporter [Acidobacteriota bacterium]
MTEHSHGHSHGGGGHSPGVGAQQGRLALALTVTGLVFVAQLIGSWITGSLALLFDSAHVLTDAAGLAMALVAARLTARPASNKRTWGFARAEVLAATAQAAVLLAVGLVVLVQGIERLFAPTPIAAGEMAVFGVIGLVGNVISLLILAGGRSSNFNLRAAFLEVLNDALGSVAVIAAALIIGATGWLQADAVVAMGIGALILPRTVKLLIETLNVLLESTPAGLDLAAVREHILALDHVQAVHDLHASQIATGLPVLTAHVVLDEESFHDGHAPKMLDSLQQCVAKHFEISVEHSTFQFEPPAHTRHEAGAHS